MDIAKLYAYRIDELAVGIVKPNLMRRQAKKQRQLI